jgi:nitrogen regulatory protein P-II 1
MKEIRAIVRPQRLALLRETLRAIPNFPGLTMSQAEGFTAPAGIQKRSVKEELTDYTPKILVTVIVEEAMVEVIRQAIIKVCSTAQIGDGLVWTVPIESIHRIRNGESLTSN